MIFDCDAGNRMFDRVYLRIILTTTLPGVSEQRHVRADEDAALVRNIQLRLVTIISCPDHYFESYHVRYELVLMVSVTPYPIMSLSYNSMSKSRTLGHPSQVSFNRPHSYSICFSLDNTSYQLVLSVTSSLIQAFRYLSPIYK